MISINCNIKTKYKAHDTCFSQGFTLLEVLIAIFILGIGLTLMSTIFRSSNEINSRGKDLVVASLLGQAKMEELIQKDFNDIVNNSNTFKDPLAFFENGQKVNDKYRWSADIINQGRELLKLKVQVRWPWPDNTHHVEYSTLLARKTDE